MLTGLLNKPFHPCSCRPPLCLYSRSTGKFPYCTRATPSDQNSSDSASSSPLTAKSQESPLLTLKPQSLLSPFVGVLEGSFLVGALSIQLLLLKSARSGQHGEKSRSERHAVRCAILGDKSDEILIGLCILSCHQRDLASAKSNAPAYQNVYLTVLARGEVSLILLTLAVVLRFLHQLWSNGSRSDPNDLDECLFTQTAVQATIIPCEAMQESSVICADFSLTQLVFSRLIGAQAYP